MGGLRPVQATCKKMRAATNVSTAIVRNIPQSCQVGRLKNPSIQSLPVTPPSTTKKKRPRVADAKRVTGRIAPVAFGIGLKSSVYSVTPQKRATRQTTNAAATPAAAPKTSPPKIRHCNAASAAGTPIPKAASSVYPTAPPVIAQGATRLNAVENRKRGSCADGARKRHRANTAAPRAGMLAPGNEIIA